MSLKSSELACFLFTKTKIFSNLNIDFNSYRAQIRKEDMFMKKQVITSAVSYVSLILAIVFFSLLGGFTVVADSVNYYSSGVQTVGFTFFYDLQMLVSGQFYTQTATGTILVYVFAVVALVMLLGLIIFNCRSRKNAFVTFVQWAIFLVVTISYSLMFAHYDFKNEFVEAAGGDKAFIILTHLFVVIYAITQIVNWVLACFVDNKREVEVKEVIKEVIKEVPVEVPAKEEAAAPVEEVKEEPAVVEETIVEEVKEEPVKEEPVEEVAEAEVVEEEPVKEEPAEEAEEEKPQGSPVPMYVTPKTNAKRRKVSFEERLEALDPTLVDKYHEIRDEIMSYGIKSRVSSTGDTFRLHTVKYMKIIVAGKKLKLYLKLNPKDYDDTTIPHLDASNKSQYADIPMVFKVQSDLSLKRAKQLIADMMEKEGFTKKEKK